MSKITEHVGQRIRTCRKKKGYTIEEFSKMINKSKATLSKYENGSIAIDIDTLLDIAEALEMDLSHLVDYISPKSKRSAAHGNSYFNSAYFYVYYLDEYNGKSDIEDKKLEFINLLKEQDGVEKLYSLDGDFPTLKSDVAIGIFNYLYSDDTSDYDTYSDVANAFTSVLNNSISIFQTLPSYISLYEQYDIGYKGLLDVINIILVISYSVSFILIYILPTFFLQDGQSLGRKFTHTILVSVDESKIKPISVAIRYLFNYITYFLMTFFIAFIFSGVDSLLYASFPFYVFPLVSFILCMVNVIFALVNKKVNSLTDVMSRSMLLIAREVKEEE